MGIVEQYLAQLNIEKRRLHRAVAILTVLSLLVAVGVSWNLRMTGITMANSAGCGWEEHQHVEECLTEGILICGYECEEQHEEETAPPDGEETETVTPEEEPAEEHVHTDECWQREYICGYDEHVHDITCYSDPKADVENQLDWQEMFEDYPYTGELYKDLVGIAKTQVGYTESALNYETDDEGMKRGYTRYGAWYGSPYSDWSAMFVSFCLEYAGADTDEYPVSPGADTMAGLWDNQGKYIAAGEYIPQDGDIVFFDDNTAGIVTEVQNSTIYVIAGDVDDAVSGQIIPINDNSIEGWGVIERTQLEDEAEVTDEITDETVDEVIPEEMQGEVSEEIIDETVIEDAPDISDGPVVTIYAESIEEPQEEEIEQIQTYSLKNTRAASKNLVDYVRGRGGGYFITLTDDNSVEVPKDDNENYIVQAGTTYSLGITFKSPNGIEPGEYIYQLPSGLRIEGGTGEFILDKTETNPGIVVGTWNISDTGLIEMKFNEKMDKRTQVAITAEFDAVFDTEQDSIEFDGNIIVTVQKPPEEEESTKLNKWGNRGDGSKDYPDTSKIYWTVEVTGQKDSNIIGSTFTDKIVVNEWSASHHYTESDIAGGLSITVAEPKPDGDYEWHSFSVSAKDPNLTWTESGWSYIMPTSIYCGCGRNVELGNDGWHYWISYSSTPDPVTTDGSYVYVNSVEIDKATGGGWVNIIHGTLKDAIEKSGRFVSDAEGGKFVWEIQLAIPGMQEGKKADYYWNFADYMIVHDQPGNPVADIQNDAHLAEATMNYNGQNITIPRIQETTENDIFAWNVDWSTEPENGIISGRNIVLLHRCDCNENTCQFWRTTDENGDGQPDGCAKYWYRHDPGEPYIDTFCPCWTVDEDVTMTFVYETDAAPLIQEYGGSGNYAHNMVELYYRPENSPDDQVHVKSDNASVLIPGVFKKELTQDFNGYTAHYQITVNEAKIVLTDGSPLTIHDVMTDTLAYISGSLVITAEDADGNKTTLRQGEDFTVTYDGTGNETDEQGNKVHVLDIVIKNPQPVMYTLDYDATLVLPENVGNVTGGIKYKNYAVVTLWGKNISADSTEKLYKDINISAKYYGVNLYKTCGQTNLPLPGATFGLYNKQGGLIAERTTDENGYILFETKLSEGIILREHELYYMQETEAPVGYMLDNTKHWFVFCDSKSGTCNTCTDVIGNTGAKRIPFEQIGRVDAVNQRSGFELPATGGSGNIFNTLCGLILISAPLVYGLSLRRKYERRLRE